MEKDQKIIMHVGDDPKMVKATADALATLKYFMREISWENRRIIPGLQMAAIKVAFKTTAENAPNFEHMWVNEVQFNGVEMKGRLLNDPEWTKGINAGQLVSFKLDRVTDWMYAIADRAYGAFTVNTMRAGMNAMQRKAHDNAWGLDFGNPEAIEILPDKSAPPKKKGIFSFLGKKDKSYQPPSQEELMAQEHAMCLNMIPSLHEQLKQSDQLITYVDDDGNTLLHLDAMAGNTPVVEIMLEYGANANATNKHGQKPIDMARIFEWQKVIDALSKY